MLRCYIALSAEEMLGIRWHMGGYEPKENYKALSAAWDKYKSGTCLHAADIEASNILEIKVDYEKANKQIKFNI